MQENENNFESDGVKYYSIPDNNPGFIKQQIKEHLDEINKMEQVSNVDVDFEFTTKVNAVQW